MKVLFHGINTVEFHGINTMEQNFHKNLPK